MAAVGFKTVDSKGVRVGDILGYWELRAGDTGVPLILPRYSDKSVHIYGTWDGATVTLKGGNDPLLSDMEDIYDFEGTVITQTVNRSPWVILPNVYAIKPVITGGGGSSLLRIAVNGRGGQL